MIILLPFMISPAIFGESLRPISFFCIRIWANVFSLLTFIRYKAEGTENFKKYKSYIYVSNHTSFLDTPAMPLFLPGQFRPLGKTELGKIPILGLVVKAVCVMVDRSSVQSRKESIRKLSELIKRGISIYIFPEGTMNRTKEPLKPFYDGAFRIAIETQAPILPITILNAGNLFPPNTLSIKPGTIKVKIGEPIDTKGLTLDDVKEVKEQIFKRMEKMIIDG